LGDLPGLELKLREQDLLNLEASKQRSELIERAGVLALGVETANDSVATGSLQKMLCHQLAAAHRRALILLAESEKTQDAQTSCLKAKTAARLINAFGAAALTLQRLQTGVGANIHQLQINGHVIGHIGKYCVSPCRRPDQRWHYIQNVAQGADPVCPVKTPRCATADAECTGGNRQGRGSSTVGGQERRSGQGKRTENCLKT